MSATSGFRAPHHALLWTEYVRAGAETAALLPALPRLAATPPGDGHRVLVLPGLMADDRSTVALRSVLRHRGYRAHGWRLGTNIGPTRRIHEGLFASLETLADREEGPVTLVGWSLGGILARELARQRPDQVRAVITLGSPFQLTVDSGLRASHASRIFHAFRPWHTDLLETTDRTPLTMPATSIYSRLDGIVPWQACLDEEGPLAENVEVRASHLGLGVHPRALAVILDRLAQPVGHWQPYAGTSATTSTRAAA